MRVLTVLRCLINHLHAQGMLDKLVPAQVYAFSQVVAPLVQHGCDLLREAWNNHRVRARKDVPGSGGQPVHRAAARPHPGGQLQLPPGYSGVIEYAHTNGGTLEAPHAAQK